MLRCVSICGGIEYGPEIDHGRRRPARHHRIQFDFMIDGVRYRPMLRWIPHEANLRRAREHLARIKSRIAAGMSRFIDELPSYRGRQTLRLPMTSRTCSDVFDAFLRHEAHVRTATI
jgi:Arm DNA-binding domain